MERKDLCMSTNKRYSLTVFSSVCQYFFAMCWISPLSTIGSDKTDTTQLQQSIKNNGFTVHRMLHQERLTSNAIDYQVSILFILGLVHPIEVLNVMTLVVMVLCINPDQIQH